MKRIKRINEDWSNDYTYDFKDSGFKIEERGDIVTGKYRGEFVIAQINSWFEEMLAKMSDEHEIVRINTFFNQMTGNASFEIERAPDRFSIEIEVGGEKTEWMPSLVNWSLFANGRAGNIWFKGALKNGQKRALAVSKSAENAEIKFSLSKVTNFNQIMRIGARANDICVSKEELEKLFDKIMSDEIKIESSIRPEGMSYSGIPQIEKDRIIAFKAALIS